VKRGKRTANELGFPSWAGRRSNPLRIVVRNFGAEMEEEKHHKTENQLADPMDVAPLGQQMGLSLDPGRWGAMTLLPKTFPGVGNQMNVELAEDESTGLRIEAVVLYLSGDTVHGTLYDSILQVGWSLLVPKYCTEGFFLLHVEESGGPKESWIGKSVRERLPFRVAWLNRDYLVVCKGSCLNLQKYVQVFSNWIAAGSSPRM